MMPTKILQKDEEVLREIAKEVKIEDIKKPKIKRILREMSLALATQDDGVAIAAPQIGYSLRIFVVAGKVFNPEFLKGKDEGSNEKTNAEDINTEYKDMVFINPKLSKLSRAKEWMPEGCLSVRPIYGKTYRSLKATVTAYDENGNKFERGAGGLLAQIFQHETDHLDGILFIDHAKDLKEEDLNR